MWTVIPDSTEIADIKGPYVPRTGTAVVPFPVYWKRISKVLLLTIAVKFCLTTLSTPFASCSISKSFSLCSPCTKLVESKLIKNKPTTAVPLHGPGYKHQTSVFPGFGMTDYLWKLSPQSEVSRCSFHLLSNGHNMWEIKERVGRLCTVQSHSL